MCVVCESDCRVNKLKSAERPDLISSDLTFHFSAGNFYPEERFLRIHMMKSGMQQEG
jgi:hypothetical protein